MKDNAEGSLPYLIFICLVAACGGLLFGYDAVVVSGTNSQVMEQYQFTPLQLGFYVSCVLWGCAIGSISAGSLADKYGRKKVLLIAAVLIFISAFWSGLAADQVQLIIARLLGGFGIGAATMVCPLYISEVSPERYRGRLVTLFQLTITIGIVMCVFSNWGIFSFAEMSMNAANLSPFVKWFAVEENWRLMFFVEALPGVIFLLCALFIPESPRWLVKENRMEAAQKVLTRINGPARALEVRKEIEEVVSEESSVRFLDLFKAKLYRPMMISLLICMLSEASGCSVVFYYGPKIFEDAGFMLGDSLGGFATIAIVNFLATILAIVFIDKIGRRKLLVLGCAGSMLSMVVIGYMMSQHMTGWPIVIAINAFIAFFAGALGPVKFVFISEIFPNRVRGAAIAFCTFFIWVTSALVAQLFPVVQDNTPDGTIYYLFAALICLLLLVAQFIMPETKNKTIEEIENSWLKK